MCGIVGYVGAEQATPILLEGLHRLEYRGYDSAGLAVTAGDTLHVTKAAVRVPELRDRVGEGHAATTGIAHTRWATHGEPADANAHPHTDAGKRVAVVHNGMIENADDLRRELLAAGVAPASDTDTEVLAHLTAGQLEDGAASLEEAVRTVLTRVDGAYGIAVVDVTRPQELVVAKDGSPIVLGIGDGEMFVASDLAALVRHTQRVIYLDDGELTTIGAGDYRTSTLGANRTAKTATTVDLTEEDYQLGGFANYMHKEIHEQPEAVRRAVLGRLDERFSTAHLGGLHLDARELRSIHSVKVLGCGSAYYAGEIGANLIEEWARIPADAEPASEFRYRNPVIDPDALYIAVSQSGETKDTLAAVQELKRKGGRVIGLVNAPGSAIARECGNGVFLHAGPEVPVASTKAVTNMAVCFAMLGLLLGRVRDLSVSRGSGIVSALDALPQRIGEVIAVEDRIARVAERFSRAARMFFVGRVWYWPAAREGAQKLKEISYIHAEAYQAAELKHGPLALIDGGMPSVVLVADDELLAKNISTLEQIKARGGPVIAVTSVDLPEGLADEVIRLPRTHPELDPIVFTIALQLFAYHLALGLGKEIDKPRNLAKSVTVE
ncbi:glucosamine--fructose-6-phosphate aminotransferase (isomerizing) [Haloechinothrix alba]|uniref:Glutamine--fructose-6-phosphate aminotransferase [isomerizing] n=1 Tax=Haloechinothrix alba TaxID=664784 RepID=A0A238YF14_9PSEU|nr:glutamine--fructose-6-phosphate transaminase (isomerizing) [Haloechinothrix alba]SNR69825.1 glucosamine--fructose-6-phosphate aminotransferase (isomerizing) [Haloechinothrix alba]